ncbi:MAG: sulfur carrier protein ThiS [Legionellales bacterium]|nr:sulfur carrier protein ThiS [Legionellales bacterium]
MNIFVNDKKVELAADASIAQLITKLNLEGEDFALKRNGLVVPHSLFAQTRLKPGDQLQVSHIVAMK